MVYFYHYCIAHIIQVSDVFLADNPASGLALEALDAHPGKTLQASAEDVADLLCAELTKGQTDSAFSSGTVAMDQKVCNDETYMEFMNQVSEATGIPHGDFSLISINLLHVHDDDEVAPSSEGLH